MNNNLAIDYSKIMDIDDPENIYNSSFIQNLVNVKLKEDEGNVDELNDNKSLTKGVKNNFINFLPKYLPAQRSIDSFTSLQKWEGYVTDFDDKIVFAQLTNLTNNFPGEFAEIPIEEISSEDKDLLTIGAVFYWNIGYHDNESGQRTRVSIIRFRRLPKWTKKELNEVELEANEIAKYFE